MARRPALAAFVLGLVLPGCPLTDEYYVMPLPDGTPRLGTSGTGAGLDATGGTPTMLPGGGDANASGEEPVGGQAGDSDSGAPLGGTAGNAGSVSGTGGDAPGAGGTAPSNGGSGGDGATSGTDSVGGSGGGGPKGGSANGGSSTGGAGVEAGRGGSSKGGRSTGGRFNGGGASGAGAGGSSAGGAGKAGAAGTGSGGADNNPYQPVCDDGVVKGAPCGSSSVELCYRTCGPDSIGFKSETCQQGAYVEQSGCSFPTGVDYSCYSVPPTKPAACPPGTPRATQSCQVAACTVCFGGMPSNPTYEDSTGTQKTGYCVCSGAGTWTCASSPSWPCPGAMGCE